MEITKVNIYPYKGRGGMKAFASVEFEKSFVVTGLKIFDGDYGLNVLMPSSAGNDGEYHDTAFPVTKKFREELKDAVINAYLGEDEDDKPKKAKKAKKAKEAKKKTKETKKRRDEDEDEDEDEDDEDEDDEDIPF